MGQLDNWVSCLINCPLTFYLSFSVCFLGMGFMWMTFKGEIVPRNLKSVLSRIIAWCVGVIYSRNKGQYLMSLNPGILGLWSEGFAWVLRSPFCPLLRNMTDLSPDLDRGALASTPSLQRSWATAGGPGCSEEFRKRPVFARFLGKTHLWRAFSRKEGILLL